MDLIINGVLEKKKMISDELIINNEGEPLGLVEQIRLKQIKSEEVTSHNAPKCNMEFHIITSYDNAILLEKALSEYKNKKSYE